MSLFSLSLRYLRSRPAALVAVIATAIGVSAVIVTMSLLSGVQLFILEHFRGTNADITIRHYNAGEMVRHWAAVKKILDDELVENGGSLVGFSPRMDTPALIYPGDEAHADLEDRVLGIRLVGIDYTTERDVSPFAKILDRETNPDYAVPPELRDDPLRPQDGRPVIILGDSLARALGVSRSKEGGVVTVMTADLDEDEPSTASRSLQFRVVGCYSTGMEDYDKAHAYIDRRQLRHLRFEKPHLNVDANHIYARVTDADRATEIAEDLMRRHPELMCTSWLDANRTEILAIEDQKQTIVLILFLMIIIASVAILGIVYMMVVEKTRDIGILRSMGLGTRRLVGVFTVYGLLIGMVGTAVGVLLGLQLSFGLHGVVDWLSDLTGKRLLDPGVYRFKDIPVEVDPWTVVGVVAASLTMSLLAAWLPAWLRMRAWSPVRCLRAD